MHIIAAGKERALVVVVDQVRVPLGAVFASKEGSIGGHSHHVGIALHMEQIETLGEGVDQFFVLGGILTEIDLRLAIAGVTVVLALIQEVGVGLVECSSRTGMASSSANFQPASKSGLPA